MSAHTDNERSEAAVDVPRLVLPSDAYWATWFEGLMVLAKENNITTSDDADIWWDDFCFGKTPKESMDGYLNSLPNLKHTDA